MRSPALSTVVLTVVLAEGLPGANSPLAGHGGASGELVRSPSGLLKEQREAPHPRAAAKRLVTTNARSQPGLGASRAAWRHQ